MKANTKHLIGRTITAVDFRPFPNGAGVTAHDPILTLDNGRKLYFITEETETGDYGVKICITDPPKRSKP